MALQPMLPSPLRRMHPCGGGSLGSTARRSASASARLSPAARAPRPLRLALPSRAHSNGDGMQPQSDNERNTLPDGSWPAAEPGCNTCFMCLADAEVDSQAAGRFFTAVSQAQGPLSLPELMACMRIAGATGFSLPVHAAAQLSALLQPGPDGTACVTPFLLEPLSSRAFDLPGLLSTLLSLEVLPSTAWTDAALRAWLEQRGTGLSAQDVQALFVGLETMCVVVCRAPLRALLLFRGSKRRVAALLMVARSQPTHHMMQHAALFA